MSDLKDAVIKKSIGIALVLKAIACQRLHKFGKYLGLVSTPEQDKADTEASIKAGYELRDVNVPLILLSSVACVAVLVVFCIALNKYFWMTKDEMMNETGGIAPNWQIEVLRTNEDAFLDSSEKKENGRARISIEAAMKKLAEEDYKTRTGTDAATGQ